MSEHTVQATLSVEEWRLIEALRQLPESPLRDRVHAILGELLFFVRNPRCHGVGIDGFPCGEPRNECEDCERIWDLLDTISRRATPQPS